jgi:hypothetical protein
MHGTYLSTYPYGPRLTLFVDRGLSSEIRVDLTETKSSFAAGQDGDGNIPRLGYDRTADDNSVAKLATNLQGRKRVNGHPYPVLQVFDFRLQFLTELEARKLRAMHEIQQRTGKNILLWDERICMEEVGPRQRGRVAAAIVSPALPGIEYYWGQFFVWITEWSDPVKSTTGDFRIQFKAEESTPFVVGDVS